MAVRVRKSVASLRQDATEWDPILEWYAKAVDAMRARPIADPTSWRYQAAVHDYEREFDPLAQQGETLPSDALQQRFWRQCQHNTWFFLPWHRMYLAFFEQIVRKTIANLSGPADAWALPYWNYSDEGNADARRLPPAFVAPRMPDGRANPLRIENRLRGNDGEEVATSRQVELRTCLIERRFQAQALGGNPGFGGPRTRFNHSSGTVVGKLETTPHGSIHVSVGDWMGAFDTAALDPLFWLHHANIDRLWAVWRQRDARHVDPTDSRWLTEIPFEFNDANGSVVSLTPSQVVDTTVPQLNYEYDDVSDPMRRAAVPEPAFAGRRSMEDESLPEMVGATEEPVTLTGQRASVRVAVSPPSGPATRAVALPPAEIYLNVENITGAAGPTPYAVYLNVPEGDTPEEHPELYAGLLPMFGVAEASRADERHAGSGLHYAFEIGEIVRTLQARGLWDPNDLRVTFVPEVPESGLRGVRSAAPASPVQIGRVSLYYA